MTSAMRMSLSFHFTFAFFLSVQRTLSEVFRRMGADDCTLAEVNVAKVAVLPSWFLPSWFPGSRCRSPR